MEYSEYKNHSKPKCQKFYYHQFKDGSNEVRSGGLPCGKWSCDICRPYLYYKLKRELTGGFQAYFDEMKEKGFPLLYSTKFLSLTYAGADRRSSKHSLVSHPEYTGDRSPLDALKEMNYAWHKLSDFLRKNYGDYRCARVVEFQKDGYPHFHILMMGGGIGKRLLLKDLRRFWVDKYGLGTQLNVKVIKFGYKAGIKYILKYLEKGYVKMPKGFRRFSVDRKLIKKQVKVKQKEWITYQVGSLTEDHLGDFHRFPYWSILDKNFSEGDRKVIKEKLEVIEGSKLGVKYNDVIPF